MELVDEQPDGSFGTFYGHPNGADKSKELVKRILKEFDLDFQFFRNLLLSIPVDPNQYVTSLQDPIKQEFLAHGWKDEVNYPESDYTADYALQEEERYIFVEVELSDIRRDIKALYMSRVFRTAYMRVGIYIIPESGTPESKYFYSRLTKTYDYLTPEYPLWVIGFTYP